MPVTTEISGSDETVSAKMEDSALKKSWHSRFGKTVKAGPAEPEAIAIVGMSGIFPGARDLNEYWQNLLAGKDCITEIPKERWDWEEYYGDPAKEANKTNIKWGGFIEGIAEFDPLFFGISPREAELMASATTAVADLWMESD